MVGDDALAAVGVLRAAVASLLSLVEQLIDRVVDVTLHTTRVAEAELATRALGALLAREHELPVVASRERACSLLLGVRDARQRLVLEILLAVEYLSERDDLCLAVAVVAVAVTVAAV